jgi:hypothetical protein
MNYCILTISSFLGASRGLTEVCLSTEEAGMRRDDVDRLGEGELFIVNCTLFIKRKEV